MKSSDVLGNSLPELTFPLYLLQSALVTGVCLCYRYKGMKHNFFLTNVSSMQSSFFRKSWTICMIEMEIRE